ncbi:MAG: LptF/LptG family permease [Bacteroidetes bacterium]|jgi:lipopolysaccharide export system permease protein|nr:LptF/LptG family permease [Bacteroidota bacterium]|tara:strand:+ start:6249 stop:7325 length:1077 start_codon:yes stop_codon:yes gene_type:complete
MKILDKYIFFKYLTTFFVMLILFIPIGILVDLSEKIDKLKEFEVPLNEIISYYLDFVWYFGNTLYPIFVFLSVIWFTSKIANNSEVTAILSSGISFNRYLKPFMLGATIIALFALYSGMFVVPKKNKNYNEFQYKYLKKGKKSRETSKIYKQVGDNDFIYVSSYNPTREMAYDFSYEHFEDNTLKYKISSRNIRWVESDSVYRLTDYFKRSFNNVGQKIESKKILDTIFSFKINELSSLNYMAETQNFFELNEFIDQEMKSGSPLINNHLLVRHKRWSLPFSTFILTLLAVSASSFKRREGMGMNLAFGIITAFTFVFFDKFFAVMVSKSDLSPFLGAWIPNIVFILLAFYFLRHAKK